jgi:hypothetical protein
MSQPRRGSASPNGVQFQKNSHSAQCADPKDPIRKAAMAATAKVSGRSRPGSTVIERGPSGVRISNSRRVSVPNASRRLKARTRNDARNTRAEIVAFAVSVRRKTDW